MQTGVDWHSWHQPYADEQSPLSRRLRLVQNHVASWLDERPGQALTVVSVCAGQGHDLLGVLSTRPDASQVSCALLELDPRNVAVARSTIAGAVLNNVEVIQADAGDVSSYVGLVPADLVLMVGVFGNISDDDVHRTIDALPELCAPGATVIWTRSRRPPDLTPTIRRWLDNAGLVEQAFDAPQDTLFAVGVHRFAGVPRSLNPHGRLFEFRAGGSKSPS